MKFVDHEARISLDDWFLLSQSLVRKGWVLQAAHSTMSAVIGCENVVHAALVLVPPFGVLFKITQSIFTCEACYKIMRLST